MKRNFVVFLLISIFIIKINNLTAQEQLDLAPVDLTTINLASADFTQEDLSPDALELRKIKIKISASKILQGLATACVCIAKIAGAKTKKEKQESTCNIVSSVFLIAADACGKHKKHHQEKHDQKIPVNLPEDHSPKEVNVGAEEQLNSKPAENTKPTEEPQTTILETKSINFEYLQQIQDLTTEQEKMDLINKILQNKQTTETLLDEVNFASKLLLIDALFGN
jgi:hypothetical protein